VGGFKSGKRAAFGFLSAAAVRRGGAAALVSPAGGRAVQAGGMPARPPVPVVAAVIVDTAGRVLLARRPAHKHLGLKWEFPGGKIEAGEAPESALARELREELGIAVEITRALPRFTHDYEAVTIEMVTFVCRLAPGSEPPVAHEHEALAWCAVDALREYDLAPADLPIVAMLAAPLPLPAVSRLPAPGDNVAIAIRRLEAGEVLALPDGPRPLAAHRAGGSPLCRERHRSGSRAALVGPALRARAAADRRRRLREQRVDAHGAGRAAVARGRACPPRPTSKTASSLPPRRSHVPPRRRRSRASPRPRTFAGYRRPGRRGVGTRNTIVILGTTSRTASFARQLAARLQPLARMHPGVDGIVAIAHTEGGGPASRTTPPRSCARSAGFIVHPNVGAVLAIDYGVEPITNVRLREFMRANGYPLDDVPHQFLTLDRGLAAGLAEGERIVRGWLPAVAAQRRTDEPLSELRVALQCGGSDAFSGVSGNPLAGALVHEVDPPRRRPAC
jgi:mutator protein MutT